MVRPGEEAHMSISTRSSTSNFCVGSPQHCGLKVVAKSIDMNWNRCLHHPPPPPPPPSVDISVDNCGGGQMLSWWSPKLKLKSTTMWEIQLISPPPWMSPSPPANKKSETRSELHKTSRKHMFLAWSEGIFPPERQLRSHISGAGSRAPTLRARPREIAAGFFGEEVRKPRLAQISVGSCRSELPELKEFVLWNCFYWIHHWNCWNLTVSLYS